MATIHHNEVSRRQDIDLKHPADGVVTFQEEFIRSAWARRFLAAMRIVMGWTFIWAFLDKLFGLGFSTPSERAWINGGTPAQGFMKGGAKGDNPFGQFFANIAGPWSDWLFMAGLLGIGVALLAGAGLKIAAWTGSLLLLFMYLAQFPVYLEKATNPVTDSHWIEALALIVVAATYAGDTWGVGKWWGRKVGNGILR